MKKLSFSILFFIPLLLFSHSVVFKIKSFDSKKSSPGNYNFTCTVYTTGLFIDAEKNSSFKIPSDDLLIAYQFKKLEIHEADLFFSQTRKDLNNDGDFNDVYTIKKDRKGVYRIGKHPISILKGKKPYSGLEVYNYFDIKNRLKTVRAAEQGVPFLIYDLNEKKDEIITGFTNQKSNYPIIEIPNPSIVITLITQEESREARRKISIPGSTFSKTRSNIKYFQNQADAFVTIDKCYVRIKPDKKENFSFSGTITGISEAAILSIKLLYSPGDNLVLQSPETKYVLKR